MGGLRIADSIPAGSHCSRLFAALPYAVTLVLIALQLGASYRTENFVVTASSTEIAIEVAHAAERHRSGLALQWLGEELPRWPRPCPIEVKDTSAAGLRGRTSYVFVHGRASEWRMFIAGPREELIQSVLPHEVLHTVLAAHFGRPLPRSLEEGICVTAESDEARAGLHRGSTLDTAADSMTLRQLLLTQQYPRNVVRFYSQGYSLTTFLLERGGRRKLIQFLGDALRQGNWAIAARDHYGATSLDHLQQQWMQWRFEKGW